MQTAENTMRGIHGDVALQVPGSEMKARPRKGGSKSREREQAASRERECRQRYVVGRCSRRVIRLSREGEDAEEQAGARRGRYVEASSGLGLSHRWSRTGGVRRQTSWMRPGGGMAGHRGLGQVVVDRPGEAVSVTQAGSRDRSSKCVGRRRMVPLAADHHSFLPSQLGAAFLLEVRELGRG